jgi:Holliday junction resolvase RusA-like endonuclease
MKLKIQGQIKSGKNNMGVTRGGLHFPRRDWKEWRDGVLTQISAQLVGFLPPEVASYAITFDYHPGDNRRRDVPGMIDALFHCLERAGVVKDDAHFKDVVWKTYPIDRGNPRVDIEISPLPPQNPPDPASPNRA